MDIVAWLLTIAGLQALGGSGRQVKDLSVIIAALPNLAEELKNYKDFEIADFKKKGYIFNRNTNVGMYLSENLRDYMFKGNINPHQEGTIILVFFENVDPNSGKKGDDSDLESITYLFEREGLPEEQVRPFFDQYENNN